MGSLVPKGLRSSFSIAVGSEPLCYLLVFLKTYFVIRNDLSFSQFVWTSVFHMALVRHVRSYLLSTLCIC